ncbi:MAG: helix-turn-helix transcriptional regulator [Clostridia bacterium]|nr:helix-turn-helix transcriptional regulator [Clostridia bacterium]
MEKDNFNANVDFVRGQADMIVLSALSDNDKYGLEILNTIQERSQGMYSLKQATLYSSLKRLEKSGYVHSYDGDVSNGAKRVYYGLTEQGRDHLNNNKSYWEFSSFLMSSLISDSKFDPQNDEKPFDPADFRPLTRRNKASSDNEKVVIKYVYLPQGANAEDVGNQSEESFDENPALLESNGIESEQFEEQSVEDDSIDNQVEEDILSEVSATVIEDEVTEDYAEQTAEEVAIGEYQEKIDDDDRILEENIVENLEFESQVDGNTEEIVEEQQYEQQYVEEERPSPIYQRKQYFDENNEINYISSFSNMFNSIPEDIPLEEEKEKIEYLTMKEMVYKFQSKGVNVKPYDKKDTMEFYVNRYYYSNKLHLHASIFIFAILALELIISHFVCNRNVNDRMPVWALVLGILAVALYPIARYVIFLIDPTKKTPATYNPKSTLLLSMLPIITLPIVFALMAFVQFDANINDYMSMERTIVLPSIMLFNVPLYFVVFTLLYRTYKYHVN